MPEAGSAILRARYLRSFSGIGAAVSQAFGTAGRVYMVPLEVAWPVIVDRILYRVGGTSGGNIRVGIYREGSTADSPAGGELVVESASLAQDTANYIQQATIADTVLTPGLYYVGIQGDDTSGTFHRSYDSAAGVAYYYDRSSGYGAFTDPCPAVTGVNEGIDIRVRVKENLPVGHRL